MISLSLDETKRWVETRQRMWEMDQRAIFDTAYAEGYEKGFKEGQRIKAGLTVLLRIGTRMFGVPAPDVLAQLSAIDNLPELEALIDRLLEMSSWGELLAPRP